MACAAACHQGAINVLHLTVSCQHIKIDTFQYHKLSSKIPINKVTIATFAVVKVPWTELNYKGV